MLPFAVGLPGVDDAETAPRPGEGVGQSFPVFFAHPSKATLPGSWIPPAASAESAPTHHPRGRPVLGPVRRLRRQLRRRHRTAVRHRGHPRREPHQVRGHLARYRDRHCDPGLESMERRAAQRLRHALPAHSDRSLPSSRAGPAVRGRGRGRDPSRTRVAAVVSGCRAGGSTDACVMLRAASRVARRFKVVLELVPSLTRAAVCAAASLLRSPEPDGPRLVAGDAEDVRAPRDQRTSRARTSYSSLACCGRGGGDGGGMRTTARMAGGPAAGLRRGGPGTGVRRGDLRGRRTRRMGRRTRRMVKVGGR